MGIVQDVMENEQNDLQDVYGEKSTAAAYFHCLSYLKKEKVKWILNT